MSLPTLTAQYFIDIITSAGIKEKGKKSKVHGLERRKKKKKENCICR